MALIPVSFGGWGVREAAVVTVLTSQGFAAEQALFFSVCYGLTLLFGFLLGALLAWAVCAPVAADLSIRKRMLPDAIFQGQSDALGQQTPIAMLNHDSATTPPS